MEPTPEEREQWDLQQIKQSHSRLFARPIGSVMRKLLSSKSYGAIQSSKSLSDSGQPSSMPNWPNPHAWVASLAALC